MPDYQSIMKFYTRIHKRIWRMLFHSNFKRIGTSSSIVFPLKIQNAKYIEIGNHVHIHHKAWLVALKRDDIIPSFIIDDYTTIGHFVTISCLRDIHIGQNVLISDRVFISDNNHGYEDITLPIQSQPTIFKSSVYIGNNSWIGQNVTIIGAKIGKHCVIGANSVVSKDIPDYCVAAGSPARVKKRFKFETNEWQRVDKNGEFLNK
ncbi:MAG: acyltransferase [Gammaproteobacteria bacterium]|nr:acyltransferase [Gammaproteobacteria bacterium]